VGLGSDDDTDVNELIQIAGAHENVVTTDLVEELVPLAEEIAKVVCGRKIPLKLFHIFRTRSLKGATTLRFP